MLFQLSHKYLRTLVFLILVAVTVNALTDKDNLYVHVWKATPELRPTAGRNVCSALTALRS